MIHSRAEFWRAHTGSPYRVLVPLWIGMWAVVATITVRWRDVPLYDTAWTWPPAVVLFAVGTWLYWASGHQFSLQRLIGVPELRVGHTDQNLVTTGVHGCVRHPIYLAHLCEMLAWSVATGLAVCYGLTAFALVTGSLMIRMEDAELERRFGREFRNYQASTPAIFPKLRMLHVSSESRLLQIVACFAVLLIAFTASLAYAYARRDQPMLFQHGTPEVPGGRAIAVMNPFRSVTSERTAERLIRGLHTLECDKIIAPFSSDNRICRVLRQDRQADLIGRKDGESCRVLVYDLPRSRSRLWVQFVRDQSGFEIRSVSLIR